MPSDRHPQNLGRKTLNRNTLICKIQAGFTLIELMMVVLIMGLIVGFVTLSIGGHKGKGLEEEAQRLLTLIRLAGEESIIQSREIALEFAEDGYQFLILDEEQWMPLEEDRFLTQRTFAKDIEMELEIDGEAIDFEEIAEAADEEDQTEANKPRVFLMSSGEITPFALTLKQPGIDKEYHLVADITGELDLGAP